LIRVNGTLVRIISGHFGNTEDLLDLRLQNEYMVDRLKNHHKGIPIVFTSYVTTPPHTDRHLQLLNAGLKDTTDSLDRYCLYTLYKDLALIDFQRIDAQGKSDTELQIGTFRLLNSENDPYLENLKGKTCEDAKDDVVLCDKLSDRCGWCQLETIGHCYNATITNYLGCQAFDGGWHGKVPIVDQVVATKEQVHEFYLNQLKACEKSSDRIQFVNRTARNTESGAEWDVDVVWRQSTSLFYSWTAYRNTWSSPIFYYQGGYW